MATPDTRKRKRQTISLAEKHEIIEASKTKPKTSELVTHFNNKYKYTAIDGILKNKVRIEKAIDDWANNQRNRTVNKNLLKFRQHHQFLVKTLTNALINFDVMLSKMLKIQKLLRCATNLKISSINSK